MSDHVCEPVYVSEGECVCFECGAQYIWAGTYNAEALQDCRDVIESRGAGAGIPGGETT